MIKITCERASSQTASFASLFFSAVGRQDLAAAAENGEFEQLVTVPAPDTQIDDPEEFRFAYFASEAFSKCEFTIPGIDRVAVAYASFLRAEEECESANSRLVEFEGRVNLPVDLLRRARTLVHHVLGDFSWDEAVRFCSFGPGATSSLPRRNSSHPNKWENGAHITGNCLPLLLAFVKYVPSWAGRKFSVVAGNKVTTVPKNAKTDRVIAIEPDWNMFFQRGVGGAIRYRLRKRLGLLRPDSQQIHKDLARSGSRDGRLATIDLKAASDSISLALCEALLPPSWMAACLTTRSHCGEVNGTIIQYEKISSMGNGFTFELETLLFWALTRAAAPDGVVSVYGDDIICPADSAEGVINLLAAAGFSTNPKKTHISGPFRESCGGHYFAGHDVTPPYFKSLLTSDSEYIHYANATSRAASRQFEFVRDDRFQACHNYLIRNMGKPFFGPIEAGDAVIHVPFDERHQGWAKLQFRSPYPKPCLQQWQVKGLIECKPAVDGKYHSLWGAVLASIFPFEVEETSHGFKPVVKRYVGKLTVPSWTGPGPWVTTA